MNDILAYYQAITTGAETVGEWIRAWYTRVVHDLESGRYRYDQRRADRVIKFIENFCRHHEGPLAPGLIHLELWQRAMLSVVFGCVDDTGARQFREIFITIGRKNGKTLLCAAISAYLLYMDGEYGARVYFVAPKLDQARLCYEGLYQTIRNDPELSAMAKKRRTDIYIADNNSSAAPLAFSARRSDGLNPHGSICDETAAWRGDEGLKQYEVLKSALGARRQPLIFSISTAGYETEGIFDELLRRSTAVIKGTSRESRLAPFIYMIDEPEKWNDINELKKANPNLGVSVSVDYMLEEIAVAENSFSKRVEFLTKYACIRQNSSLAWLDAATVKKSMNMGTHTAEEFTDPWTLAQFKAGKITDTGNRFTLADFSRCYACLGVDLSQTVDLTAVSLLIQRGGVCYYFTHFFLPSAKLEEATMRDGVPYAKYIEQGWLTLSGENIIDFDDCYNWICSLYEKYKIYILQIGLDRYCAQFLQKQLEKRGFHCDTVFQGTNLTGIINTAEGMLKDGALQCADSNELMKIHLLDSALQLFPERNQRKLIKISRNAHVDGMASLLDALCMRANVWEKYRQKLINNER